MVTKNQILEAVKEALQERSTRRFRQSVDVEITLKGIDASKQDTSFSEVYAMPRGLGSKRRSVCVIADSATITKARSSGADRVLSRGDLESLLSDKKSVKKLARSYDFFVAETGLMSLVGRGMGQILGPRNKIPVPLPPSAEPKPVVERLRNSVRIRLKGQPVIRCVAGSEDMEPEAIAENILGLTEAVAQKVKGGASSIGAVTVKLSMGKPVSTKEAS
ncbi:MAG: 50S ribosomal protein L1 [Candidatus Marsarchaeota archaeon]|nr:50S ribosomal protein L1 [Candidatus Marsarchaeota archaeon]